MENRERRVTVTPRIVDGALRFAQDPVQHEETNGAIPSEGRWDDYDLMITIQNPRPETSKNPPPIKIRCLF